MAEQQTGDQADEGQATPSYQIDVNEAETRRRSLPMLIASKRCYACQSADDEEPTQTSDIGPYIERIVDHCAETPDYPLEDTPLKEALFRAILAGKNEPATSEELSEMLKERWAMTPNPRNISPQVIQKVLDQGGSYCIVRLPEPESEEEDAA